MARAANGTPFEALTHYRTEHPITGEIVRFIVLGFAPGAAVRRMQILWGSAAAVIIAAFAGLAVTDMMFGPALVTSAVIAVLIAGLAGIFSRRLRGGASTLAVLSLGRDQGVFVSVELGQIDEPALDINLAEAGIDRQR